MADGAPSSVLGRISAILHAFDAHQQTLSVAELVAATGLPRPTAHRLAMSLVDEGWLVRNGTRFELGLGLFELGQRVARQRDLREVATPFMTDLQAATGHSVTLAVLDRRDVVYVQLLRAKNAPESLRKAKIGGRLPAHATGVGKALLAFTDAAVLDDYVEEPLVKLGPRTIGDPAVLRTELAEIRENGVAFDRQESAVGLMCAAAPVFVDDPDASAAASAVAAISISGQDRNISLHHMSTAVKLTAQAVSRSLASA